MSELRLFGTDGVRGVFGEPPLDPITITALGDAIGKRLQSSVEQPMVVLGGDTRASSQRINDLLTASLRQRRVQVRNAGVIPTPGVAWLVRHLGADAGIVVSASHNPYTDNGIKLLSSQGGKLDSSLESQIETDTLAALTVDVPPATTASETDPNLAAAYRDHLVGLFPDAPLTGLRLAIDAANGAASPIAAQVFQACGADVHVINADPDGTNINRDCGSLHPEQLQDAVRSQGADLGIAFDGDADRAVLVDEHGTVRDGDAILFLWASSLAASGSLRPRAIVATTMSNLGLEQALAERGIDTVRCGVGDRAVVESLNSNGLRLGGEQSGHVVDLEVSTTGDGLVTGLTMAAIVARSGRPLSELLTTLHHYPQLLVNVDVGSRPPIEEVPELAAAIARTRESLGDHGRLVIRYSGTEPLLRIMIESADRDQVEQLAGALAETARRTIPTRQEKMG